MGDKPLRAVVFGGTGAVGKEIVAQLAASPRWASVVTVGRRAVSPPPPESTPGKLKQLTIDMDTIESNPEVAAALADGVETVFCALGTTRATAGSAEAFKKVDLDYVEAAARAAGKAGVSQFSLVSAVGANAGLSNFWANDMRPFHGFLYSKCKGLAEETAKEQGFKHTTIMRPGFLNRGDLARWVERVGMKVMSSVPVSTVAAAMIADAEAFAANGGDPVKVWSMKDILAFGKEAAAGQ